MKSKYKKMKNLFLRQSYLDSWEDYQRSLNKTNFIKWDYIILTASNEAQASSFRDQIQLRLNRGALPATTKYAVLPDPEGKRVGSGGATFNVMRYIAEQEPTSDNCFANKRILVIHSGGDSKRVPQYSTSGKLFSPVPRELPNGYASTLFDEFIITMSGVPSRIKEGMLVLSGDVLLLFNPLQIDLQYRGAAAISIKEHVSIGKNHGVFLNDGEANVKKFLHKQTEETLNALGAVNEQENVDLDTGAVIFDTELLKALYSLISTDNKPDDNKFYKYVNDKAKISFYGDFLYPLAKESTLEQYYQEAAEGKINETLLECRKELWNVLSPFSMKLLCLAPAEFIHFGTTKELLHLMTRDLENYEFLNWKKHVLMVGDDGENFAAYNTYLGRQATVEQFSYVENSYVLGHSVIGENSVISNVKLRDEILPDNIVVHGLPLMEHKYVVRIYGAEDNPKAKYQEKASFLGTTLLDFLRINQLHECDLWEDDEKYLWNANLYPVCATMQEALKASKILYKMKKGEAEEEEIINWKNSKRMSLYSSFNYADTQEVNRWQEELGNRIISRKFIDLLEQGIYYEEALEVFGARGITEDVFNTLLNDAKESSFGLKIRIYFALSRFMRSHKIKYNGQSYDALETMCFRTIQKEIYKVATYKIDEKRKKNNRPYRIVQDEVKVELPVRVNWGGGWTDTPPHCNEQGGMVLNAAVKLNGIYPIQVEIRKLEKYHVEFESTDIGVFGIAETIEEIQDCNNPYDSFALHKAALISAGLIPMESDSITLQEVLKQLGGGIYISTQVIGIPKGSGLGTSSILAGACIKAIYEFLGETLTNDEIYDVVLAMEQLMSTGGGWQDQVGGLTRGVKLITSNPGIEQVLQCESIELTDETKNELQERFALIYTGQRRLARNLLRSVMGNYIGNRPETIQALQEMKPLTLLMKQKLDKGDIEGFAELLNQHWDISKRLDASATNTCIEQIFKVCEDLICGRFICGAGGGGFLQVILKKDVTKRMLRERLLDIFQDSGVDVWDSELLF